MCTKKLNEEVFQLFKPILDIEEKTLNCKLERAFHSKGFVMIELFLNGE